MSIFWKEVLSVEAQALQELAQQLLRRLDGGAAAQSSQREFAGAEEKSARAELEFLDAEQAVYERGFSESAGPQAQERQFAPEEMSADTRRGFAELEQASPAEHEFLDVSMPQARAEVKTPQIVRDGGYAMDGRSFFADLAADRHRDMEEISEFFRRDGRRYDSGFKQY